jgi:hypothetical protein
MSSKTWSASWSTFPLALTLCFATVKFQAIQFYTQCVILCKKLHTDNATLKKILFKQVTLMQHCVDFDVHLSTAQFWCGCVQVLCMMKVGLYNKAIVSIHQLMSIATSL